MGSDYCVYVGVVSFPETVSEDCVVSNDEEFLCRSGNYPGCWV